MAEKVKAIKLADGTVTNLVDKKTKLSVNYRPVTTYYDGSAMTNAKVDGDLYIKNGTTFYRKVIDKDGELFLEKDTMVQMRALTAFEILLLKAGVYKGVTLNGYYTEGDTPAPIQYFISQTSSVDDGGSVIVVDDIKLEHKFVGFLDVRYYGVFSDGVERTSAINTLISYASLNNCIVEFTEPEYLVNSRLQSNRGIILPSNTKINTSVHTVFKSTPQDGGSYAVFYSANSENISINRLKVIGERGEHIGTTGEWGMGLSLNTCKNVNIEYLECNDCWGDGLYLGKVAVGSSNENINIGYFKGDNNRRQGISVVTADGLNIKSAYISNTKGTAPEAGIDLEPNHPEDKLKSININNITTKGNAGGGIIFVSLQLNDTTPFIDITINNHTSIGEHGFSATGARATLVKGSIVLNNFKNENAPIYGMYIRNYANQPDITINNPVIINSNQNGRTDEFASGIYISREASDVIPSGAYNPLIRVIKPFVKSYDGKMRRGIYVNNTTGNVANNIENVYIEEPYVEGASASPLLYQSSFDVIDKMNKNKRIQVGSNTPVNAYLTYTNFSNLGSVADIRVQLGSVPHYSKSSMKIKVESPSRFGIQMMNGAYLRNLGSTYTNISSNTVGDYLVVRCVDAVNNIWELEELVGNWTIGGGKTINTLPKNAGVAEKGLVSQSAFVAFPTTSPLPSADTNSTATDVAGLVSDFNDLVGKFNQLRSYSAENRTTLTSKLTVDRDSGQQATS